jgi:hypothetical protein
VSSSMLKTMLQSSVSMSLRLSVVHLHVVVEVTLGARKNVLWTTEKFKQYIQDYGCNAHAWWEFKCEHRTLADSGACNKCASANTHLHSLLFLQFFFFKGVVCVCKFLFPPPLFWKVIFFHW